MKSLMDSLSVVKDPRKKLGVRFSLSDVLFMTVVGIMSGYSGYRELGRFMKNNADYFVKHLGLHHGVPCYVTIRTILQEVDFDSLDFVFQNWASQYATVDTGDVKQYKEQFGIDGKAIGSTIKNGNDSYQEFISLISVFAVKRGVVVGASKIDNHKKSEIPCVQELIQSLGLEGVLFSMDALHCQKKNSEMYHPIKE